MIDLPRWAYLSAWLFWLVWFGVWETLAILDKGENETFSGHMKLLMWQNGRPTVVAWIVLPILAWLIWHFYWEVRGNFTT